MKRPSFIQVLKAIGWVTFLEILKDRVLYNIILCAVLLLGMGVLASRLTFIHPDRVILDFGLTALVVSCGAIATFTGSGLLSKEVDRRTIFVAMSRPISKVQFLVGKFVGVVGILLVNWFLLSLSYLAILQLTSEEAIVFTPILFVALLFVLIESILIASIAIFFASFSTTSLAVIFTVGIYFIGNNISQISLLSTRISSSVPKMVLKVLSMILPNFEHFSLGTRVTYALPVSGATTGFAILYGLFMVVIFLILGGALFQSREV